ncbi:MAG: SDR family oxidoreductase [Acidimicrobiia bacterium]|nr:SDR family oxidoreductase [Acidimicrobiia bacterium]
MSGTFDLSGHVAVVTGGNSGIGAGFARGLARAGASVAVWGRTATRNDAVASELRELGGEGAGVVCDVTSEDDVVQATEVTLERYGRIDSCFANAGGGDLSPLLGTSVEQWDRVLRLDLTSVFLTFREVARHMVARGGGGRLVATSSIGTIFGMPRQSSYSAAKAGVDALVRSLAVELARHAIRVNSVLAGWVDTPMTAPFLTWEKFDEAIVARTPVRRWGRPEDFEGIAVYLASPASEFMTGETLRLDGGYSVF